MRDGDLLALPAEAASADAVISVFGVIFASDPAQALREIGRVMRPGGRAFITAWVPAGPIDAMLGVVGRTIVRITQAAPPHRFTWSDPAAVGALAAETGLALQGTTSGELAIRGASPEAYVAAGREHPMALAVRPIIEQAGASAQLQAAMTAVLREANKDPDGFLVHSPYVIHELRVE